MSAVCRFVGVPRTGREIMRELLRTPVVVSDERRADAVRPSARDMKRLLLSTTQNKRNGLSLFFTRHRRHNFTQ